MIVSLMEFETGNRTGYSIHYTAKGLFGCFLADLFRMKNLSKKAEILVKCNSYPRYEVRKVAL